MPNNKNIRRLNSDDSDTTSPCCVICLEKTDKPHNCKTCSKKAWYCCFQCEKPLLDKTCPVCRGEYAHDEREWSLIKKTTKNKNNIINLNLKLIQSQIGIEELCQDFPKLENLSIIISNNEENIENIEKEERNYNIEKNTKNENNEENNKNLNDCMDEDRNSTSSLTTVETTNNIIDNYNNSLYISHSLDFNGLNIKFNHLLILKLKGKDILLKNIIFNHIHYPNLKELELNDIRINNDDDNGNTIQSNINIDLKKLIKLTLYKINLFSITSSIVVESNTSTYQLNNNNFGLSITKCISLKELKCIQCIGLGDTILFGNHNLDNIILSHILDMKRLDILFAPKLNTLDVSHCLQLKKVYIHNLSCLFKQPMESSSSSSSLNSEFHPISTCHNNQSSARHHQQIEEKREEEESNSLLSHRQINRNKNRRNTEEDNDQCNDEQVEVGTATTSSSTSSSSSDEEEEEEEYTQYGFDMMQLSYLNNTLDNMRALCYELILDEECKWEAGLYGYNEAKHLNWELIGGETFEFKPEKLAAYLTSLLCYILESAEEKIIGRFLNQEMDNLKSASDIQQHEESSTFTVQMEGSIRICPDSYQHVLQHKRTNNKATLTVLNHFKKATTGQEINEPYIEEDNYELPFWLKDDIRIKALMNGEIPTYNKDTLEMDGNVTIGHGGRTPQEIMRNITVDLSQTQDDKYFIVIVICLSLFGLAGSAAALPKGCSVFATLITATVGGFGGGLSVRLWKIAVSSEGSSSNSNSSRGEGPDGSITIVHETSDSRSFNHRFIDAISFSIRKGPMGWIIGALVGVLVSYTLASSCQIGCGEKGSSSVDLFSGLPLPAQSAYLAILLSSPALFEALRSAITACLLLLVMAVGAIIAACYAAQAIEKFHNASASGRSFLPGPSSLFIKNGKLEFIANFIEKIFWNNKIKNHSFFKSTSPSVLFDGGMALLMSAGGITGHSMILRGFLTWDQFWLRLSCFSGIVLGGMAGSVGMCKLYSETSRLFERDPVGFVCCSIVACSAVALFGGVLGVCFGYFLTLKSISQHTPL